VPLSEGIGGDVFTAMRIKTNAPAENNPPTEFCRVQVLLPDGGPTPEFVEVVPVSPDTAVSFGRVSSLPQTLSQ